MSRYAWPINHGKITTFSSFKMPLTILSLAHSGSIIGSKDGNLVWTPLNIPVLMKYGHIQVVLTFDLF